VRNCIKNHFKERFCRTLVRPVEEEELLFELDNSKLSFGVVMAKIDHPKFQSPSLEKSI
jgi:hypothetical protein